MNNSKSTFEDELKRTGRIIYTNVGDSMMPLLRQHRDVMVIERPECWDDIPEDGAKKLHRLDVPLYKRDSGQYVLHRILKVRKDDYVICGDNRWFREYGISDRHILGVLVAVIRDGKEIPMDSLLLRIYSHIWCDFFWVRAMILWVRDLPARIKRKIRNGKR